MPDQQNLQPQSPIIPVDVMAGRYANHVYIAQVQNQTASGEAHTRSFVLNFLANYPEGIVCTSRVVMDREDFSGLLKFLVKESAPGGQFAHLMD